MSLQRRIVTSYVIIIVLALLTLLGIGGAFMVAYYAKYDEYATDVRYFQIEKNGYKVKQLVTNSQYSKANQAQIIRDLHAYHYRVRIFNQKTGKVIYTDKFAEDELYFVNSIRTDDFSTKKAKRYQWSNSAFVSRLYNYQGQKIGLVATKLTHYRPKKYNIHISKLDLRNRIIFTLWAGVLIIVIVALTVLFFSKRTLRRIMAPLDKLVAASRRIEEGQEFKPVVYTGGDYEMEVLIKSFNDMQTSIKEYMDKTVAYERARTKMISGISHDLNTPLTSIKGCLKGIIDGVARTPERQKKYIEIAYNKAAEMEGLLQQLFYLSKLETGNMPANPVVLDLRTFVSDLVAKNRLAWEEEGAQLSLRLGTETSQVKIDAEQLRRVLVNIIENAIKYNDKNTALVTIDLITSADEVKLCLGDNGPGVPEDKLGEVFNEFYRGDESRNTKKKGSGLGLYIARTIINQAGGTISARNEQGLKITLTLPRIN